MYMYLHMQRKRMWIFNIKYSKFLKQMCVDYKAHLSWYSLWRGGQAQPSRLSLSTSQKRILSWWLKLNNLIKMCSDSVVFVVCVILDEKMSLLKGSKKKGCILKKKPTCTYVVIQLNCQSYFPLSTNGVFESKNTIEKLCCKKISNVINPFSCFSFPKISTNAAATLCFETDG